MEGGWAGAIAFMVIFVGYGLLAHAIAWQAIRRKLPPPTDRGPAIPRPWRLDLALHFNRLMYFCALGIAVPFLIPRAADLGQYLAWWARLCLPLVPVLAVLCTKELLGPRPAGGSKPYGGSLRMWYVRLRLWGIALMFLAVGAGTLIAGRLPFPANAFAYSAYAGEGFSFERPRGWQKEVMSRSGAPAIGFVARIDDSLVGVETQSFTGSGDLDHAIEQYQSDLAPLEVRTIAGSRRVDVEGSENAVEITWYAEPSELLPLLGVPAEPMQGRDLFVELPGGDIQRLGVSASRGAYPVVEDIFDRVLGSFEVR